MTERTAGAVALAVTALSGTLLAVGTSLWILAILGAGALIGLPSHQATIPISGVVLAGIGGLVLARHPMHPIAWILVGAGLLNGIEMLNLGILVYSSLKAPGEVIPAPAVSHWLAQWLWSPRGMIPMTFLPLLFPSGHLPSKRWRIVSWAAAVGLIGSTLSDAFTPNVWDGLGGVVVNPYGMESPLVSAVQGPSGTLLGVAMLACMASVFVRLRRASGTERQQLKVMGYTLAIVTGLLVIAGAAFFLFPNAAYAVEISFSIINLCIALVAIGVGIAVLRYRLYDIDLLINRTLVYGVLTLLVAGVYALIVGILGVIFQSRGNLLISLAATGLIAVLFQPMREALQRRVNHWVYGDRDEPYQVLSRLGRSLEGASPTETVLSTIVETVAQTLKLPYVAISLPFGRGRTIVKSTGSPIGQTIELPLGYRSELVGHLLCSTRESGEVFTDAELGLLKDIANQVAVAVYALQLSGDLQLSRQRLVTAREEERRRLRRDLHDGLGPQLASLGLRIDTVKNLLESDPQLAAETLARLRLDVKAAIADIRRLVYNLRPPVLDELGLLLALKAGADLTAAGPSVVVEGPDEMPPLPAAVEVAAYRIAQEALTNAARHARARHCTVRLHVDGELLVEVQDDGVGMPRHVRTGVGLNSIRERTAELGGSFSIQGIDGGGTLVSARFPLQDNGR